MANRVSIADIARELQLAPSTISRALNDHPSISAATKQRIWQLAKEREYQPNHLAAGLRKGRSNLFGVVVPFIESQFFAAVVDGIESMAARSGFSVIICQSNEDVRRERKSIDVLLSAQVEGIILSLARTTRDFTHLEQVRRREIPLVFFDRVLEDDSVSAVVVDDYQGAYQLTSHLIEQGCQTIAHLAGPLHLNVGQNRYRGYIDALRAHGMPVDEDLIVVGDFTQGAGEAGMEALLSLHHRPDGVFSASNSAAVGAMGVLKRRGLRIPHDVALAGFSNETFSSLIEPALTTVDQSGERMGETAVRLLQEMLEQPYNSIRPKRVVLPPGILVRDSSRQREARFGAGRR